MVEFNPTTPRQTDGWLSPEGVFYACGWGRHERCARHIIGDQKTTYGATDYLESHGWLHISEMDIVNTYVRPTQDQQNTLFDMQMLSPTSRLARCIAEFLGKDKW